MTCTRTMPTATTTARTPCFTVSRPARRDTVKTTSDLTGFDIIFSTCIACAVGTSEAEVSINVKVKVGYLL